MKRFDRRYVPALLGMLAGGVLFSSVNVSCGEVNSACAADCPDVSALETKLAALETTVGTLQTTVTMQQTTIGDLQSQVNALACPADSVRITDATLGSYCITKAAKAQANSYAAYSDCGTSQGRICTSGEITAAYKSGQITAASDPQGEWAHFVGLYNGSWYDGAGCTGPSMWSYDFVTPGPAKLDCVDLDRNANDINCGSSPEKCAQYRCCR
jgi:hypothetical protein